jgi:cellulose synthase/poly-beta-1,6-N-acetylglucosamine synthase-like glycosyltransferase
MLNSSQELLFFWGAWVLIPFVVDFVRALRDAGIVWRNRAVAMLYPPLPLKVYPRVSVIIPAHNEQLDIDRCITSLKAQTYPHHRIEVIVIDDGSTDRTEAVVNGHINGDAHWNGHIRLNDRVIEAQEFGGALVMLAGDHNGKPAAVNMGFQRSRGEIIFTIDSDVVLAPEAIEQAVVAFHIDPELTAATAHLIVDQNLLVEANDQGHVSLDVDNLPYPMSLNLNHRILAASQFLEYLQAFRVGRHAEAIRDELFTLSGACAIFRREALHELKGYSSRTVSEDTDATLSLRRGPGRVGYLPQVHVHLAPSVSWSELFSQRVRWQRGELEVLAVHGDRFGQGDRFWKRCLPARLRRDHTLALLRLVWALLLPLFPSFGYEPSQIAQAVVLLYALYLVSDYVLLITAWPVCSRSEQALFRIAAPFSPFLPIYRTIVYLYRLSGILRTISVRAEWTTTTEWLQGIQIPAYGKLTGWVKSQVEIWAD